MIMVFSWLEWRTDGGVGQQEMKQIREEGATFKLGSFVSSLSQTGASVYFTVNKHATATWALS